jgi:hypothetical protein
MQRNTLKITCPDETPTFLEVELNGKKVEHLISLRAEIPSGDETPLLKVQLEFYSALELNACLKALAVEGKTLTLSHPPLKT